MSRESKKQLYKQWNRNARNGNKDMHPTDPDSEDALNWNPVDFPVDGLESNDDYGVGDEDDDSDDEEFEDEEGDYEEYKSEDE